MFLNPSMEEYNIINKHGKKLALLYKDCKNFVNPINNFGLYRNTCRMFEIEHKNAALLIPSFTIMRKDLLANYHKLEDLNLIEPTNQNQKLKNLNNISEKIMKFNLLQKSIVSTFIQLDSLVNHQFFSCSMELLENCLDLAGGTLDENRGIWASFMLEMPNNSYEKVEYKKLKKIFKNK